MSRNSPAHLNDKRRNSIITASEAHDAIYARQKLFRVKTFRDEPFEGNDATRWGNNHEPIALAQFEDEHNVILGAGDKLYVHDSLPLGASPDGIYYEQNAVVEIKCPYSLELYKTIPERYYFQTQIQMLCTGKEKCYFYVWTPDNVSCDVIKYNQEFIDWYIPLAKAFMEFISLDKEPPRWNRAPRFNY